LAIELTPYPKSFIKWILHEAKSVANFNRDFLFEVQLYVWDKHNKAWEKEEIFQWAYKELIERLFPCTKLKLKRVCFLWEIAVHGAILKENDPRFRAWLSDSNPI